MFFDPNNMINMFLAALQIMHLMENPVTRKKIQLKWLI